LKFVPFGVNVKSMNRELLAAAYFVKV